MAQLKPGLVLMTINKGSTCQKEVAAPTVMLESVFITTALEAEEGRNVAVIGLPGAFLHAKNEDNVIMTMSGRLAELIVVIAIPIYRK